MAAILEQPVERPAGELNVSKTSEPRTVIELDHIHKTYTMGDVEVHALRGVSLTIKEGEAHRAPVSLRP